MRRRINILPSVEDLLGSALFLGVALFGGSLAGDPGLGWHLKTGELIRTTGAIPVVDPFLYGSTARPWVAEQWLADLAFFLLWQCGGMALVHVSTAVICVLPYAFILPPLVRRAAGSPLVRLAALALGALNGCVQWFTRPVIASFLLFALCYAILWKVIDEPERRGRLLFLPPLFAFWANLHPGFVLGFIPFAAALLHTALREPRHATPLAAACAASAVATLCTPFGTRLFRSIATLVGNPYFMELNSEWLSPDLDTAFFVPFLAALVALLMLACRAPRRVPPFELAMVAVLAVASLLHRRYIPFFGLVLPVPLARLLSAVRSPAIATVTRLRRADTGLAPHQAAPGRLTALLCAACVAFAFTGSVPFRSAESVDLPQSIPAEIIDVLGDGAIFHSPDAGGYLVWRRYPAVRPAIDDRNQLLGPEPYERFFTANGLLPGWQDVLRPYRFALLDEHAPLRAALDRDPHWRLLREAAGWRLFERCADRCK